MANPLKTAWELLKWAPEKAMGGLKATGSAIGKSKTGTFLATGAALVAGGFGLKSWYEHRQERKAEKEIALAPEAGAMQAQIAINQKKLQDISAELGQNNPQGNWRDSVRSGGMGVGSQPEYNP